MAELRYWAERTYDTHRLQTIFFGGGTPSLMAPETVGALIEAAQASWPAANDLEITLEANPTSSEAENFAGYAAAGVNRLSLGVQSFDDTALKFLGRQHDAAEARGAIALAAKHFPRTSFDLIYARPGQTSAHWRDELQQALDLNPSHIALYQLTIEPDTGFAQQYKRGAFQLPDSDLASQLYEDTGTALNAAGLHRYEISNYARPGMECRHNLGYWQYDDYIGIGAGAHGRICVGNTRYATATTRLPERWLQQVQISGHALEMNSALADNDAMQEALLMGLRLETGISLAEWQEKFIARMKDFIPDNKLRSLVTEGDLILSETHLRATKQGLLRLNAVLDYLLN